MRTGASRCRGTGGTREAQRFFGTPAFDERDGQRRRKRIACSHRINGRNGRGGGFRDQLAALPQFGATRAMGCCDKAAARDQGVAVPGRLGFIDHDKIRSLQHRNVDLLRRRQVGADKAFEGFRGSRYDGGWYLQLTDQGVCTARLDRLRVHRSVCARCDHDLVLAGRCNGNQRDAGRQIGVYAYTSQVDATIAQ